MPDSKLLAVCGLDCASCPARRAYLTDDNGLRARTAEEWNEKFAKFGVNFKPKDINCVGCRVAEGVHVGHCGECQLRQCALQRKVENCSICAEFASCQIRRDFEAHSGLDIAANFKEE